jgi:soluble lytic murein transglycosylase-like protein
MFHRLMTTTGSFASRKARQSATFALFVRDAVSGFLTTMHHALMVLGLAAIAAWGVMFFNPEIADHLKALSPFTETVEKEAVLVAPSMTNLMDASQQPVLAATSQAQAAEPAKEAPASSIHATTDAKHVRTTREQQWVTAWLSRRYRVAKDATNMLVSAAYVTASEIKLDPLLILAVMAIESGFNPFAESPVGAQGLMQVMSKVHHDKFRELGGIKAALNPVANIKVGSVILKDYVNRGGSVEAGLKLYVGAAAFENDSGYGSRVLAEYRRLKEVSNGKKVPIYTTTASAAPAKTQAASAKAGAPNAVEATTADQEKLSQKKTDQVAAL